MEEPRSSWGVVSGLANGIWLRGSLGPGQESLVFQVLVLHLIHLVAAVLRSWGWRDKSDHVPPCLCDIPRLLWETGEPSDGEGPGPVEP